MSTLTRTVEEVVLGLTDDQGRQAELPVAIVADRHRRRPQPRAHHQDDPRLPQHVTAHR
jgi:hypothetical protein